MRLFVGTAAIFAAQLVAKNGAAVGVVGAVSKFTCTTDVDCSLAGTCINGACKCEDWVKGPDCAALNLDPLPSASALKSIIQPAAGWTRWGGSVVQDPTNASLHHVFAAEMAFKCGLGVWTYKSQVCGGVPDCVCLELYNSPTHKSLDACSRLIDCIYTDSLPCVPTRRALSRLHMVSAPAVLSDRLNASVLRFLAKRTILSCQGILWTGRG